MFPPEERDAISKTLHDTILELVPGTVVSNFAEGEFSFNLERNGTLEPFCLMLVEDDRITLSLPNIADPDGLFEPVEEGRGCRLMIRKRADMPGQSLNDAIERAARKV
ncbi:MAG: hypothetical protein RIG84_00905 [Roseovarius sp.]